MAAGLARTQVCFRPINLLPSLHRDIAPRTLHGRGLVLQLRGSTMKRLIIGVAALALLVGGVGHARAESLVGSTMHWQYYAYGGAYFFSGGQTSGTFVDSGTNDIGGAFIGGTEFHFFDIRSDANSITFDYRGGNRSGTWAASDLSLAPTIHNGIAIDMIL